MGMHDQDADKKVYQFATEVLDDQSIEELNDRIESLRLEISRCENEIAARHETNEAAESVFRK